MDTAHYLCAGDWSLCPQRVLLNGLLLNFQIFKSVFSVAVRFGLADRTTQLAFG